MAGSIVAAEQGGNYDNGYSSQGHGNSYDRGTPSYDLDNKTTVPQDGVEAEALGVNDANLKRGLTQRHLSMIALAGACHGATETTTTSVC